MTIRAVTFDCWGTLITDRDMSRAMARRVKAVVDSSGGRLPPGEARNLVDRAWRAHHDAWVDGSQYGSEGMARFCANAVGAEGDVALSLCVQFEEAGLDGDVELLEGARESLAALRASGLSVALVCDTGFTPGRMVREMLARLGLAEHLQYLAFSNEVGVPKPHPAIFRTALEAVGAEPREAVHVGDLLRTDISGAKALGMKTVRITAVNDSGTAAGMPGGVARRLAPPEPETSEADEVISSHAELLGALRRLGAEI